MNVFLTALSDSIPAEVLADVRACTAYVLQLELACEPVVLATIQRAEQPSIHTVRTKQGIGEFV